MDYLFDRLKEKSTWTGLMALIGSIGVFGFTEPQTQAIAAAAVAVVAVIQMFAREKTVTR